MEAERNEAKMKIKDGFTKEDLCEVNYAQPLVAAAQVIIDQNYQLIERTKAPDFDPVKELEYASNGARIFIHDLFEAIALYEEGRVPPNAHLELIETTEMLLQTLEARTDACLTEIDLVRVAFNKSQWLWRMYPNPRCKRNKYVEKIFKSEECIAEALEALHRAYLKAKVASMKTVKKSKKRREKDSAALRRADDKSRVFAAITDLTKQGKCNIREAIRRLKRNPTWASRMRNVTDETWRRYYTKARKQKPVETSAPPVTPQVAPQVTPQVAPQVTPQVKKVVGVVSRQMRALIDILRDGEMGAADLQKRIGIVDRKGFRLRYLRPALDMGLIEMTIPESPNSRLQKYRLAKPRTNRENMV